MNKTSHHVQTQNYAMIRFAMTQHHKQETNKKTTVKILMWRHTLTVFIMKLIKDTQDYIKF